MGDLGRAALLGVALCLLARPAVARSAAGSEVDLTELSLTEMLQTRVTVTSVTKQPQSLDESAAAITVLSREDIRRSGVTNVPDALRMVPDVQVAQIDSSRWAISARGFNDEFSNKLLVLVDGRIVYDPLFAGVYWNAQDVLLEDIDRIEVIRGPGATLWGSNAVNGVINIVTLSAHQTQGNLVTATSGNQERDIGGVRHGGRAGDVDYRVYAKTLRREPNLGRDGRRSVDDWNVDRAGFRTDWEHRGRDAFTVQGDVYQGHAGQTRQDEIPVPFSGPPVNDREDFSGENLLARWTRTSSPTRSLQVLGYVDHTSRANEIFSQRRTNLNLELQQNSKPTARQSLVLGATYRSSTDDLASTPGTLIFDPPSRTMPLYSFFVQDEIDVRPKRFKLTLGTKFEHNVFTGWEVQPTVRGVFRLSDRRTLWSAVSRAVRIPTRVEEDVTNNVVAPAPPPDRDRLVRILVSPNRALDSEVEMAYETGYRMQVSPKLSFDLATFYNEYSRLQEIDRSPTVADPTNPAQLLIAFTRSSDTRAHSFGEELAFTFRATPRWKLAGSYTDLHVSNRELGGESPSHVFELRSFLELTRDLELDTTLYAVDAVSVPDYTRVDVQVGYHVSPNGQLSLVAQNLVSGRHEEFGGRGSTVVVPSTFLKFVGKF